MCGGTGAVIHGLRTDMLNELASIPSWCTTAFLAKRLKMSTGHAANLLRALHEGGYIKRRTAEGGRGYAWRAP
jgi:DNA-binding IclR family transcriptional regulator